MIVALLLAASSLRAQVVSPVLGRMAGAPIAVPASPALLSWSNAPMPLPAAPSLAPSPILLAALPVAAAPADAPSQPAASLDNFWDGLAFSPKSADAGRPRPAPWLSLRDEHHARALDAAVELARGTSVGRRALAAAQRAVEAQGGVLAVDVLDLRRNFGEYDYLTGRLRLHRGLFAPGREGQLAGTLVHELLHVAQHAAGLPSYALELEIEAHLQDLEMTAELGLTPPPHTFARQARAALARGPDAFVELIQAAVPGSVYLGEDILDDVIEQLEQDLESAQERRGSRAEPFARSIEEDLDRLRTPAGAAAYRAFSRRVRALLERRSAAAKG